MCVNICNYEKRLIYLLRILYYRKIINTKHTSQTIPFIIKYKQNSTSPVTINPNRHHSTDGNPWTEFCLFPLLVKRMMNTVLQLYPVWWMFEYFNYIFMFTANVRVYKEDAIIFSKQSQRKTKSQSIQHPHKHSFIGIRAFLQNTGDIHNLFKYLWKF
jgi:hypothetical protein